MRSGSRLQAEPRVVLLAKEAQSLASTSLTPFPALGIHLTAAYVNSAPPVPESGGGRQLRPVDPWRPLAWRSLAAATLTRVVAKRAGVRSRSLWAVKSDRWLRGSLRMATVVASADEEMDDVLGLVPDLVGDSTVVQSTELSAVCSALHSLAEVLSLLETERRKRVVGTRIQREALAEHTFHKLAAAMTSRLPDHLLSSVLLPVDRIAGALRWLHAILGPEQAADLTLQIAEKFSLKGAQGWSDSGLEAQHAIARLLHSEDETSKPTELELTAAFGAAISGADQAFESGRDDLARGRLTDALALLFHRERHAETLHSPLVSHTREFLRELYASKTFRKVSRGVGDRVAHVPRDPAHDGLPRVLVLSGAYGNFHDPVVQALSDVATVTLRHPRELHPFYGRTAIDPQVVDALGEIHGLGPSPRTDSSAARKLVRYLRKALGPLLANTDILFADWADRLTVLASHLAPEECRLVVRIHSLDALDPWFHLVDWRVVDQVIVVSEPLRNLVVRMLEVAGADVPVTVLANIAALPEMDLPKHEDARTTLGMVGWGRRVKDPLWALDLLERDPSWRLVLIGPRERGRSASAKAYHSELLRRLQHPDLRNRVDVVGPTDDVAGHLRQVGVILSTSRRESWHLGLIEGAASGAVPVVRNWPLFAPLGGAYSLLPSDWVVESLDEAEARIREVTDPSRWDTARRRSQEEALALFNPEQLAQQYREALLAPLLD